MEFELTDEQEQLRETARAFLGRECPISLVRDVVEKDLVPDELWVQMVQLGWPALTLSEDVGGLGLGFIEMAVLAEEIGWHLTPAPFLATATQFAPIVRDAGNDDQRRRFLGAVAQGEITGTLAVAEEDGKWTADAIRARARRDGSGWVLEGTKHFVANGATADELVVAARLDDRGDDSLGLFVVPADAVDATPMVTPDRTQPLAIVRLGRQPISDDRLLGDVRDAAIVLDRALQEATTALALSTVGTCQAIFDIALAHAKEREQFGVPIGSFQAIKHKFTNMLIAVERARATGYFAALTIAEDDDRRTLATAMAKAAAGDCQRLLAQEGVGVLGGIGYTWEHDMHLYVKRAKAGDALFGTAAAHRAQVASLIGL